MDQNYDYLSLLPIHICSIICLASMLVSMSQTMKFLIFCQFKTPLVVNAAQHNTTTVYISTLTYEKDTFDLKSIRSQKDITEQRFSDVISLGILTNSTIL